MAAKRMATNELNHDNWADEEEPEEKGIFQKAAAAELKNRVIKTARRKLTPGDQTAKTVFSGFTGFGKPPAPTTNATNSSPFSFLSKITSTTSSTTEPTDKTDSESKPSNPTNFAFDESKTYYAKLKGLNQAVSDWIKTHIDKNPLCILTPVFEDYQKYLKEIEQEKNKSSSSNNTQKTFSFGVAGAPADSSSKLLAPEVNKTDEPAQKKLTFGVQPSSSPKTSFASPSTDKADSSVASSGMGFSFGATTTATTSPSSPKKPGGNIFGSANAGFSFASSSDASKPVSSTTGFSFSASKPFTFASSVTNPQPSAKTDDEKKEDEDDEPPKVEFKAVVEEDSIYSKRCKVFVKSGEAYAERGVGTLYIKDVKDSEKKQAVVRADTNLGNILLNVLLSDGLPAQRLGKNNVMLVCLPTPDSEKPTTVLLRVKTGEDADELLETIEKYKK